MKVLKGTANVVLIILSVGICFGIFGLEIGIHSIYGVRNYFTVDGIKNVIKNMDFDSYLNSTMETDNAISNEIYNSLNQNGFDDEIAKEIINSNEIKEVVGNYISSSIDAVINDTEVQKPTVEEIMSIIKNNDALLEKIAEAEGVTLTEETKNEYLASLEESMPSIIEKIPDINQDLKNDKSNLSYALRILNGIFSLQTISIIVFVILILYLLIALFRWSFHKAMLYLGIPTILSSLTILLIRGSLKNLKLLVDDELYRFLDQAIFSHLTHNFLISGFVGLLIGISLVVGYILISKITKKEKILLEN